MGRSFTAPDPVYPFQILHSLWVFLFDVSRETIGPPPPGGCFFEGTTENTEFTEE